MQAVSLKAYAKINLALDVLRRREDGYHEIRSVVQTISLADDLRLILKDSPEIQLVCTGDVPRDERNLAYRAARLLQEETQIPKGVRIELEKTIPVGAGLGGGSADAAAVVKGLNDLWELGLSEREMLRICARLGSDVPFCLLGGTALMQGRGEVVEPLPRLGELWLVLVRPRVQVSTAQVYRAWSQFPPGQPMVDRMLEAIRLRTPMAIAQSLGNMLEPVASCLFPEVAQVKWFLGNHTLGAVMSGSGPTVFGIVESEEEARDLEERIKSHPWDVFVVRTV